MAKKTRLHMIGNAHIDPVWLWQWQEGFHEVKATFRSALDRMNEYDDFVFVASSAAFYEWVEKSDPAMFKEIVQRVAEGRWGLVGGWWIEPDCNIPGGESFVRQGLYGQRYFKEKFGVTAKTGFNVDSFGHANTLPQILKKSGLPYYVFLRPQPHEKSLPSRVFWWQSDDGSRVLACRIPYEYLSWSKELDLHVQRCAEEMREPLDEFICFYGVGNHGGGPTKANLDSIRRLNADPNYPELMLSTPDAFFESIEAKGLAFPVIHGDLQRHAPGCYSAHSGIKRWNRQAENRLITAEKWSAVASYVAGQPYPTDFEQAWKAVLFNQFHDILAGTSLESAYEDARNAYGEAISIADRNLNYAIQSIMWNIGMDVAEGVRPIVVFNPHGWNARVNVELEMFSWKEAALLVDENDQPVPYQEVQSQTVTSRRRMSFMADLPALGYRTYRLVLATPPAEAEPMASTDTVLENSRLRVEFDPETGFITRMFDKAAQVEVFAGAGARPVVIDDPTDTWGHNAYRFDDVVGEFKATSVKLVANGAVKSVIRVTSQYNQSTLIQDFTLYPDSNLVEVNVVVDWREQLKAFKLRFPINLRSMTITAETPYGHIEAPATGEELPFQSWLDISGIVPIETEPSYGFSLLNDGKYSMDVNVRDIGLTVLRSPVYAHHIPSPLLPDRVYAFTDQGVQQFRYAMLPHAGNWERAGTVRRAAELNQPPLVMLGTFHPNGALPQSDSYIEVQPESVVVSVLKQAEDGDDLVLRAVQTLRAQTRATICLPTLGRKFDADFAPSEIKTFRIPRDPSKPVVETNMLEWVD